MAKLIKPPEIGLKMTYSKGNQSLAIHDSRVTGLPLRKDGKRRTTYIKCFLFPKFPEMLPRPVKNSEIKREDNHPAFSQRVEYESVSTHELINSILHLEVLEYSCLQKHDLLGEADLHLVHVDFIQDEATLKIPLKIPERREKYGTVLVSLAYEQEDHKLSVWLVQGKNVRTGVERKTDVQAKVSVTLNGEQTLGEMYTNSMNTSSPCFGEDGKFCWRLEPSQIQDMAIHIEVLGQHPSYPDKYDLGHVTISNTQNGWSERMHWANVIHSPSGTYFKEWHELRREGESMEDSCTATSAQLSIQLEYKTVRETLTIKIENAKWNQKASSPLNSFARLAIIPQLSKSLSREDRSTNVIVGESSATFNEEMEYECMEIEEFYNSILQVELVDYRHIEDSKVVGQTCVQLSEVPLVQGKARLDLVLEQPVKHSSVLISLTYNRLTKTIICCPLVAKKVTPKNQEADIWAKLRITDGIEVYGELTTRIMQSNNTLIFSEKLKCTITEADLKKAAIHLAISYCKSSYSSELGELILGSKSDVQEQTHWNEFLSEPTKSNTHWYTLAQEGGQSLPVGTASPAVLKMVKQSTRKEVRHRSALVSQADRDAWKTRHKADQPCKRAVHDIIQKIEKQRPWSDLIEFPASLMTYNNLSEVDSNAKGILSLNTRYDQAEMTFTVKLEKATGLECPVFDNVAQERLSRIAQGIPINAVACLYLESSQSSFPLRKSKKSTRQKFKKQITFAEEIQFKGMSKSELDASVLHVGILGCDFEKAQLIGQGKLVLANEQAKDKEDAATLPLYSHIKGNLGKVRISLLYQSERQELVVILLRGKDLNNQSNDTDAQARIWVASNENVLGETFTDTIEQSSSPTFNKTLSVAVDPSQLRNVVIRISIHNKRGPPEDCKLGQVLLSSRSEGEEYRHWNDTLASPGERLMEWHELHYC